MQNQSELLLRADRTDKVNIKLLEKINNTKLTSNQLRGFHLLRQNQAHNEATNSLKMNIL